MAIENVELPTIRRDVYYRYDETKKKSIRTSLLGWDVQVENPAGRLVE
jgi:hypothetical protein